MDFSANSGIKTKISFSINIAFICRITLALSLYIPLSREVAKFSSIIEKSLSYKFLNSVVVSISSFINFEIIFKTLNC